MTDDLFFDTDCLSAFLWINDTNILQALYGGRIILPFPVYRELSNPRIPHLKRRADALIDGEFAFVQEMKADSKEYELYRELVKGLKGLKSIGAGEAAGIALAKTYNGILASNNYKDIAPYIEKYDLKHIDTGHILMQALEEGLITQEDGNVMWQQMLNKNRKLPASSFAEYLKRSSFCR